MSIEQNQQIAQINQNIVKMAKVIKRLAQAVGQPVANNAQDQDVDEQQNVEHPQDNNNQELQE